jgi:antitoxin MazE
MTATISKWGNSQGLRFPKEIMKELNLSTGDKVKIITKDHKVIIEPIKEKRKKYNINDLVNKIPDDYNPYEEFNDKVGIEEW